MDEHPNFADWFHAMMQFQDEDGRRRVTARRDRLSALFSLASSVKHLPGCTAECGVFKGASSYLIVAATRTAYSLHYCFDSFQGLSTPQKEDFVPEKDDAYWMAGKFAIDLEYVTRALDAFRYDIAILPGWIPTRFAEVTAERFSFVHIDVDFFEPTRDSIAFFYPRMIKGGIVLFDDYDSPRCPGARKAIDAFLAGKPQKIVPLSPLQSAYLKFE